MQSESVLYFSRSPVSCCGNDVVPDYFIYERLRLKKEKKVTFAPDCKIDDGASEHIIKYASFFCDFAKGKIQTVYDVISNISSDMDFIDFCLEEAKVIKKKLNINDSKNSLRQLEYFFHTNKSEEDPYWDHPFFKEKAESQKKVGVPLVRYGCGGKKNYQMSLFSHNIPLINKFIILLEDVQEFLFFSLQ